MFRMKSRTAEKELQRGMELLIPCNSHPIVSLEHLELIQKSILRVFSETFILEDLPKLVDKFSISHAKMHC